MRAEGAAHWFQLIEHFQNIRPVSERRPRLKLRSRSSENNRKCRAFWRFLDKVPGLLNGTLKGRTTILSQKHRRRSIDHNRHVTALTGLKSFQV